MNLGVRARITPMSEGEMVSWLAMNGDKPAEWRPGEMTSVKGERFIRSREGQTLVGNRWEPKYIWSRV